MERRFCIHNRGFSIADVNPAAISFLSKTSQVDEYYRLAHEIHGLQAGLYRIRNEGLQIPLLTLKTQGDGQSTFSETIDQVNPDPKVIDYLRKQAEIIAVVEKDRTTYKSKILANCILHFDVVQGLGDFIDIKADSPQTLEAFLKQLKLHSVGPIQQSYLAMKEEQGLSSFQLKTWKFHQRFQDYIMGVVSGTLTPLGFLSATIASTESRSAMVVALMSAGFCDGISDSVANSQTTQSGSRASTSQQIGTFLKTMAGKVVVPFTFVPIALTGSSNISVLGYSLLWASLLLASTAAVQAVANQRSVTKAVARIVSWGVGASIIGSTLGDIVPKVLGQFFTN